MKLITHDHEAEPRLVAAFSRSRRVQLVGLLKGIFFLFGVLPSYPRRFAFFVIFIVVVIFRLSRWRRGGTGLVAYVGVVESANAVDQQTIEYRLKSHDLDQRRVQ